MKRNFLINIYIYFVLVMLIECQILVKDNILMILWIVTYTGGFIVSLKFIDHVQEICTHLKMESIKEVDDKGSYYKNICENCGLSSTYRPMRNRWQIKALSR